MLKGNRSRFFAAGLGVGLGIGVAYWIGEALWMLNFDQISYDCKVSAQTGDCAYDYSKYANDAAAWSFAVDSERREEKAADETGDSKGKSGDYHDALDLPAQWLAALSAARVVKWTIFQTILSAIGLGFLAYTLIQTRKSLALAEKTSKDAREIGEAQVRAYISVNPDQSTAIYVQGEASPLFEAHLKMTNQGDTPAYNVRYRARFAVQHLPLPNDFDFSIPIANGASSSTLGAKDVVTMFILADRQFLQADVDEIKLPINRKRLIVYGLVEYNTVFSQTPVYTQFCKYAIWTAHGPTWVTMDRYNNAT
jgi:hypothetical protein